MATDMLSVAYTGMRTGTGQEISDRTRRNDTGPTLSDLYLSLASHSLYMHTQCHPGTLLALLIQIWEVHHTLWRENSGPVEKRL